MNTRIIPCIMISISLISLNFSNVVSGQDSAASDTSELQQSQNSDGQNSPSNSTSTSSEGSNNSTEPNTQSEKGGSAAETSQNSTSTGKEDKTDDSSSSANFTSRSSKSGEKNPDVNDPANNATNTASSDSRPDSSNSSSNSSNANYKDAMPGNSTSATDTAWNSTNTKSQNSTSTNDAHSTRTNRTNTSSADTKYNSTKGQTQNSTRQSPPSSNKTKAKADDGGNGRNKHITNSSKQDLALPDFAIAVQSNYTAVKLGEIRMYDISIISSDGFNSSVVLTVPDIIPRVVMAFTPNPVIVPANGAATSKLVVVSDEYSSTGRFNIPINVTSMENPTHSHSLVMIIETWQQMNTTEPQPSAEPIVAALPEQLKTGINSTSIKEPVLKSLNGTILDAARNQSMIMLSTEVKNNNNIAQPFIIVIEVRDGNGFTQYIQLQKGILSPFGEEEIDISWIPARLGIYEIHSFVINDIQGNPEPISVPERKTFEVK